MTGSRAVFPMLMAAVLGAGTLPSAAAGEETGHVLVASYEEARTKLLHDEVLTSTPIDFALPRGLEDIARARDGSARGTKVGIVGSMVVSNDESGDSREFAGSGTGMEYELAFGLRKRWDVRLAFSRIDEGMYSAVDEAHATLERYMLGVCYPLAPAKALNVTLGGGVAWSSLRIEVDDPNADIAGLGAFVDVGLELGFGKHIALLAKGRMILWQGIDGIGNRGSEQSSVLTAGVSLAF